MQINIKMKDCKFFVDEEKRTVVCVIENTKNYLREFLNLNWFMDESKPIRFEVSCKIDRALYLPDRFTGKAVCSKEDEWNVEIGKLIAFDRAKHKFNTSFFKRAQKYINEIDNSFNELITHINNYGSCLEIGANKRLEHIKRLAPDFEQKNKEEH